MCLVHVALYLYAVRTGAGTGSAASGTYARVMTLKSGVFSHGVLFMALFVVIGIAHDRADGQRQDTCS